MNGKYIVLIALFSCGLAAQIHAGYDYTSDVKRVRNNYVKPVINNKAQVHTNFTAKTKAAASKAAVDTKEFAKKAASQVKTGLEKARIWIADQWRSFTNTDKTKAPARTEISKTTEMIEEE